MARIDGLDGYVFIHEKNVNLFVEAIDFYERNNLDAVAAQRGWTQGAMFEALIQSQKSVKSEYKRSYIFSIPSKKAKTKSDKEASPAASTYALTLGLMYNTNGHISLSPTGRNILNGSLSVQTYTLNTLSKVGLYVGDNRQTNLLTAFCKYAINHRDDSYTLDSFSKVLKYGDDDAAVYELPAREDMSFNALVLCGILSLASDEKYYVAEKDFPLIEYIAMNGDSMSAPIDGDESFMGDSGKGILEIVSPDSEPLFEGKYRDVNSLIVSPETQHVEVSKELLIEDVNTRTFAYKLFELFGKNPTFELVPKQSVNDVTPFIIKDSPFNGLQMFAQGPYKAIKSKEDGTPYDTNQQWFDKKLSIGDQEYHLNSDWTHDGKHRNYLMLKDFVAQYYHDYVTEYSEGKYQLFKLVKSYSHTPVVPFTGPTAQMIYYGCPGTGKSFAVKDIAEGENGDKLIWYELPTVNDKTCKKIGYKPTDEQKKKLSNNVFRTTFHPDYDYATFVGCYKPCKDDDGKLDYKFVPQVFTNAYVAAHRHPGDPIYLIIEEINRGNCAQIFGDLFQLLDRTDGVSEYEIKPDTELAKHLKAEGVPYESLKLPANLQIYATMNTSDQSLFPMDSAFKRRWAMEYMPINYSHNKASKFKVRIGNNNYKWIEFLQMVNSMILNATDSEDKQMGEFFIKDSVSEKEFINKVMFYLWNDVCKDLYNPRRVQAAFFMRVKNLLDTEKNDFFTFAELFGDRNKESRLLEEFMKYLEAKYKENHTDFNLTIEPAED